MNEPFVTFCQAAKAQTHMHTLTHTVIVGHCSLLCVLLSEVAALVEISRIT